MKYKLAKIYDCDGDLSRQWFVYFFYQHPETGKLSRFRRYISSRVKTKSGRRDIAHRLVKEINARLQMGWNPFSEGDKKLTLITEALNHGLELKFPKCGKRGRWTYASAITKFIEYLKLKKLDKISIQEFNYYMTQDYLDFMMIKTSLNPRSINNRIDAAKAILNELRKREYIIHNPFERIEKMKVPEAEITAFTRNELKQIKQLLPGYEYNLYVISQMIFDCFLRLA